MLVLPGFAQNSTLDPTFQKIPFDQWLGERDEMHVRWSTSVSRAELSFHQRLIIHIENKVDGRDLEGRREHGRLVFFVQLTDSAGARYQDHGSIELDKLDANIKAANLAYAQQAFVLPGEYRLDVAIFDTQTREHSVRQSRFRVAEPQRDSLPEAWRNLPPVEFIAHEESPESWYLPDVKGRLEWAAGARKPANLHVMLNVALSVPSMESRRPNRGNTLAGLLPTLKVLSQTSSPAISEQVEINDLSRRKSVFRQKDVRELDWARLKSSLGEANTASIDLHSLSERHHDAQFFLSRVRALVKASENSCVLVVLTPPVAFESGEDLDPISPEGLPPCSIFYIRYREAPQRVARPFESSPMAGRRGPLRGDNPMNRGRQFQPVVDQLAATLKPLNPKIIDVETPDQIARVLTDIRKLLASPESR